MAIRSVRGNFVLTADHSWRDSFCCGNRDKCILFDAGSSVHVDSVFVTPVASFPNDDFTGNLPRANVAMACERFCRTAASDCRKGRGNRVAHGAEKEA